MRLRAAIALAACLGPGVAHAATPRPAGSSPLAAALGRTLGALRQRLRPSASTSPVLFLEYSDAASATLRYADSPLFPVEPGTLVRVLHVGGDDRHGLWVDYRGDGGGDGEIWLRPSPGRALRASEVDSLVHIAFLEPNEADRAPAVVGDEPRHVVHAPWSNHLPAWNDRVEIPTVEDAERSGWRACPACFPVRPAAPPGVSRPTPPADSRRPSSAAAAVTETEREARLRAAGERVLSHWMFPLRGLDYRFRVEQGPNLDVTSDASGLIRATSAFMDAMDTDAELDAVLAHEIAHVELAHGPSEDDLERAVQLAAGVAALVVGGTLGGPILDPAAALGVGATGAFGQIGTERVFMARSRQDELEADATAIAYAARAGDGDARGLADALRVLQFGELTRGRADEDEATSGRPTLRERITRAENARFAAFDSSATFTGRDPFGRALVTVRLECQILSRDAWPKPEPPEPAGSLTAPPRPAGRHAYDPAAPATLRPDYRLLATVSAAGALPGRAALDEIEITTAAGRVVLRSADHPRAGPGHVTGVVYSSERRDGLLPATILGVRVPGLPGVARWTTP